MEAERPLRSDARRNRDRILDAARQSFAEEGSGVQMEPIARRAGVGVGTLYRNFPTKQALVAALVQEWATERAANLDRALAVPDPWEAVADNVRSTAEAMSRDAGLREAFRDLPPKPAAGDESIFERKLAELIDRARHSGVIRAEVTAEAYHGFMVGLSAAISAGTDWRLAAEVLLNGVAAR
ncbi:TetR/AcrR family transcriptional regulator [Saccharopolyspora sp. K220]|uniref:TetR/AcrR family transcriptional regulator n=1 Tax=Saccharopolyspora soli TaxID=2926618 RepID=UPI001F565221|nr:TetR/AcrR family transcriptional regulator [Saccharopolyspora soli]MCI2416757.1 TetR/AcrR family transcriptional regulator [Saccharopolyspora soli]